MRIIKHIDKDHNGFITTTEIDDILKQVYKPLEKYDIQPLIKRFRSVQNKILVDYKLFRNYIIDSMKNKNKKEEIDVP